jgi:membrane protease subunit HflC
MSRGLVLLLLLLTLGVAASFCVVILDEREQAFRTLLDKPDPKVMGYSINKAVLSEPGWYVRIPGLHQLYRYERRLLRYEANPRELYTSKKLVLKVDYYAMWQIADTRLFFESVRTLDKALGRLDEFTYGEVRKTLGLHTLADLLSEQRPDITEEIARNCGLKLAPLGIRLVDLKIRRIDYPEANLDRIFQRMRTERERDAKKFRAEGEEQARTIRAEADLDSQKVRAEATKQAEYLRGEGDARAAAIYAEAYGRDPEFYAFVRSLDAYREALNEETTVILSPSSPFLRHFFSNGGEATP